MLDGAKLRLYLQLPKRAPLLFHSEANRDDDTKNKKKLESGGRIPCNDSTAMAFRDGECESHNMTARCLVNTARRQKKDTGDAAAVPGAFGNTGYGPGPFGAIGLPSVGHSRGIATVDGLSARYGQCSCSLYSIELKSIQ
jgi:hypothetical protein